MSRQHLAVIVSEQAFLSQEWAAAKARELFGSDVVDSLPKFVRGPKKGQPKGFIRFQRVQRGGWVREQNATASGDAVGHVEKRVGKVISANLCEQEWRQSERILHSWELARSACTPGEST